MGETLRIFSLEDDLSVKGLERLEVWKKARDFAVLIYKEVLPLLPSEEKWVMAHQIRRSSQSIPANIAEGYGRFYYQDNIRFCYISRGSLDETLSHLVLAHELQYIPGSLFSQLLEDGENLTKLINGYISYLKKERRGADEPGSSLQIRESIHPYIINPLDTDP